MADARADSTRETWLATLDKFRHDRDRAANAEMWSPRLDAASRDELTAIQNEKLRAAVPFLYENSPFYRRRFERLGLLPSDLRSVDDLREMAGGRQDRDDGGRGRASALRHLHDDDRRHLGEARLDDVFVVRLDRACRGCSATPTSTAKPGPGRTRAPCTRWASGRGDTVFMMTGYGPHVWAWGVQYALEKMELPTIPGGGMDARARANIILRFKPTILLCTPSYALHLGRLMQSMGHDPAATSVHTLFVARRAGAGDRVDPAPHREPLERAHRRILRLHRGVAACRRLFLPGADPRDRRPRQRI